MSNYGTKETVEFLDFCFDLADATERSLEDDGKINLFDAPKYGRAMLGAPAAFGGIQLVPKELGDLQPDEREFVMDHARKRFDIPNDELEVLIENTLSSGWAFADNLRQIVTYKKAS